MMEEFSKLLRKKLQEQGGPKEGPEMEAKKSKAKELSDILGGDILEKMKGGEGLSKVTVASDSPEGLKEGLDKAEDILEKKASMEDSEESDSEEEMMEESEDEESGEEMEDKIAELEKQLAELKSKRK